MTNPSISVVVPMYKVERYIKICVDSILAQTFQDFEIILVDDASPDNCAELCRELYGDNDKVKLVRHEKNLGLGPARNTGIEHSRGKYIHFVDSDDFILPNALEKFFDAAEKNNADVVHACGRYEFTQDAPEPFPPKNLQLLWDKYDVEGFLEEPAPIRLYEKWRKIYPTAWLYFCRRDFLQSKAIKFLPIISEDEPFHFALICFAEKYYVLREALYVYRRRNDSIMGTKNAQRFERGIRAMLLASNYVASILDMIPRFEGYDQWRKMILDIFLERFFYGHTRHYYENPNSDFETDALVKKIFTPLFGNAESFVRFFFSGYHTMRRRADFLTREKKTLRQENLHLKNLSATFLAEQPALLEMMTAIKSDAKKIFLLGTPRHGNLGDHAIALGEIKILREYFPEHEIVDIPQNYLLGAFGELLWGLGAEKFIRDGDVICYTGGGNLGNLWLDDEYARRLVIAKFPQNKIVIFPQSIYFTDDDAGRRELAISQKIYNAHKDLHLMTRDEVSFDFAQKFFPQIDNHLLPDAATVLRGITDNLNVERNGVLFILRRDKEKVRNDDNIRYLQKYFAGKNIPFDVTDTMLDEKITAGNREQKIFDMLAKIRGSKLVVTDRFHGVIFSFVTRTPVIAFKSFDTKISSGIKWFRNFPSIFYAEGRAWSDVENFIRENYFADTADSAALTVKVKTDSRERFFRALDKIVDANKIYRVKTNPPPLHPRRLTAASKKFLRCTCRCRFAISAVIIATWHNARKVTKAFSRK